MTEADGAKEPPALSGWQKLEPGANRTPFPRRCFISFFLGCCSLALQDAPRCLTFFALAVLCRVGFDGLLRPAEMVRLRRRDIFLVFRGRHWPRARKETQ